MATSYGRGTYGQRGSAVEQVLAEMAEKAREREQQQQQDAQLQQRMKHESTLADQEMRSRYLVEVMRRSDDPRVWEMAKAQGLQLPDFRPLPAEEARDAAAIQSRDLYRNPDQQPPGFGPMSAFQVATGAALPQHGQVAAVNRDLYTRPNMPQQMVEGADMSLGRKMTAKEAADARQDAIRSAAQAAANNALARQRSTSGPPTITGAGGALPTVAADPSAPTGDAFLKTLDPFTASLVKKIANYEADVTKASSMRGGGKGDTERLRLLKQVAQYDPTYDMTQYASRNAVRADFTKGKAANNIRSLNTAVKHIGSLAEAVKGLENFDTPALNWIGNAYQKQTGDKRVVQFKMAANAVESELASLFKGTGATDQEIKAWRENLSENMSPEQLNGAITTAVELMTGRLAALSSQWQSTMGKPRDFVILSKQSRETLKKLGVDPDEFDTGITAGGAGGQSIPPAVPGGRQLDDATAQQFLKQAGGDKAKARQLAKDAGYTF